LDREQLGILSRSNTFNSVATPAVYGTFMAYQGAYSGHWGGTILPGAFLPDPSLVATSLTGDFAPGFSGTPQEAIDTVVRPLVKEWAADAQLVTQYYSVPHAAPGYGPPPLKDEAAILSQVGWPLTYTSAGRRENLAIWVAADRNFVARTTWGPAPAVTLSETSAIATLVAAVQNPGFKSVEELKLQDAFLGTPLNLAPPGEPKSSESIARSEPVYGVPENAEWTTVRMDVLGRAVWFVSLKNVTQVVEGPRVYVDQNVAGWVDARTGEVLRFRRMTRETYKDDAPPITGS
jgi:hypothetical protein